MTRRVLAAIVAASFLWATFVSYAIADHVNEPTAPITSLDLHLENYALNLPTPCDGSEWPYPNVRLAMYVGFSAAPSEHFTAGFDLFYQVQDSKTGQMVWKHGTDVVWPHQNVPPHGPASPKFDAARLTDLRALDPGLWRVTAFIEGDESGLRFADSCEFRVVS